MNEPKGNCVCDMCKREALAEKNRLGNELYQCVIERDKLRDEKTQLTEKLSSKICRLETEKWEAIKQLEQENAELVEALESILPSEYGNHGGPLCYIQAYYEDGTESSGGSSPFKTKTRINHATINKARAKVARVKEA